MTLFIKLDGHYFNNGHDFLFLKNVQGLFKNLRFSDFKFKKVIGPIKTLILIKKT